MVYLHSEIGEKPPEWLDRTPVGVWGAAFDKGSFDSVRLMPHFAQDDMGVVGTPRAAKPPIDSAQPMHNGNVERFGSCH